MGPSLDVRGGHVVRFEDGTYLTTAHLRPHLVDSDKLVDLGECEAMLLTPARRLKGKSSLRESLGTDPLDLDVGEHNPEHPAEQYALGLLREDHLEPEQLEILAYMLPGTSSVPKRFGVVEDALVVRRLCSWWSCGLEAIDNGLSNGNEGICKVCETGCPGSRVHFRGGQCECSGEGP